MDHLRPGTGTLARARYTIVFAAIAATLGVAVAAPADRPDRPDPAVSDVTAAILQQAERRRKAHDSPEARHERSASRHAFADASAGEALSLARSKHPHAIAEPRWRGLELDEGARVSQYHDRQTAVLDHGHGKRSLAVAFFPLLGESADGHESAIDTSLVRHGDWYAPRQGLTDVRLDPAGDAGYLPRSSVGVRAAGAASRDADLRDDKLFAANAYTDTDVAIAALPNGVETFHQIRSVDSPEELTLAFDLPQGAHLRRSVDAGTLQPRGAEVVQGDRQLAVVSPPAAEDAAGDPVPVSYDVAGDRLTMTVKHRDRDYLYPILVDPTIIENFLYWRDNGSIDFNGWFTGTNDSGWWDWGAGWRPDWGRGLYVNTTNTTRSYWVDAYGSWNWQAPRQSYIYRAEFGAVNRTWNWDCMDQGIYSVQNWNWESPPPDKYAAVWPDVYTPPAPYTNGGSNPYHWGVRIVCYNGAQSDGRITTSNHYTMCPTGTCDPNFGTPGNVMVLSQRIEYGDNPRNPTTYTYMGGAALYINDRENPIYNIVGNTSGGGWYQSQNFDVSPTAHDDGLGMKKYELLVPRRAEYGGGNQLQTRTHPCEGARCPQYWQLPDPSPAMPPSEAQKFTYSADTMPEGRNTVQLTAFDELLKTAVTNWQVKVDRSAPSLTLSGEVRNPTGGILDGNDPTLHIDARDGSTSSPSAERSGVAKVTIKVDSDAPEVISNPNPCDNCPIVTDWTFPADEFGEGTHSVTVQATDNAGFSSAPQTFNVNLDPTTPDLSVTGALWDADGEIVSEPRSLGLNAVDGDSTGASSGVEQLKVEVDQVQKQVKNVACTAGSCELTDAYTFNPASFTEGPHDIQLTATDRAGNTSSETVTVYVEQLPALASQTMALSTEPALRIDGATAGENAGASVARIGDLNGDGRDDYAIGAPKAGTVLAPVGANAKLHSGSVYVVYGRSATTGTVDLASLSSSQGYRIDGAAAGDLAGSAVAPAGDVNADGVPDLLIGAPGGDGLVSGPLTGKVYVVFGTTSSSNLDLAALGTRGYVVTGPAVSASLGITEPGRFGASLAGSRDGQYATASDVNGDGRDDFVLGASDATPNLTRPQSGAAWVLFGKADNAPVSVDSLATGGFRIDGAATDDALGRASAVVGDVNGDGLADVVVTAPDADYATRANSGAAYAVYGKADANPVDAAALGSQGYAIYGDGTNKLGSSVATMGDLQPDGLDDFVVGGHGAWVFEGTQGQATIDLQTPSSYDGYYARPADSTTQWDNAVVAPGGDLNDDDTPDLLVAFPTAAAGAASAGQTYAVVSQLGRGAPSGTVDLATMPGERGSGARGAAANDLSGSGLAGVDMPSTGTEYSSMIVGAPGAGNNSRAGSGSTYAVSSRRLSYNQQGTGSASNQGSSDGITAARNPGCYNKPSTPAIGRTKVFDCRITRRGNYDRTRRAPKGGYVNSSGQTLGYRSKESGGLTEQEWRDNRGNARRRPKFTYLQPNSARGNAREWPIKDSFGTVQLWLRYISKHKYGVYKHDPATNAPGALIAATPTNSHWAPILAGRGCMSTEADESTHALIDFGPGENASPVGSKERPTFRPPPVNGVKQPRQPDAVPTFRGFIPRAAFPAGGFPTQDGRQTNNGKTIDSYSVRCDKRPGGYRKLLDTDYTIVWPDYAVMSSGADSDSYYSRLKKGSSTAKYGNYQAPKYYRYDTVNQTEPIVPRLLYGNSSTTQVAGGAIVMSVLPPRGGYKEKDYIDWVDGNVPCSLNGRLTQWHFINANPAGRAIYTWVPAKVAEIACS